MYWLSVIRRCDAMLNQSVFGWMITSQIQAECPKPKWYDWIENLHWDPVRHD